MVRRGDHGNPRVALTALHGVGGELAMRTLRTAGFGDVHTVASQFAPDPDFPTVAFPNPEEPGAADALLQLADEIGADIAIALDPDADRCAVGIPTPDGWRMLSGDETGWLLGDYILSTLDATDAATSVVANSVVSSTLLGKIAADYGARHVVTLTGFKWLARADAELTGFRLVYAYEEAIGHCVDPAAVRDKDGISAAVLACDLVAHSGAQGISITDALDRLALRHGVHTTAALSRRVADAVEAAAMMDWLRADPPAELAGFPVGATVDGDAVFLTGGDQQTTVRVVVRPRVPSRKSSATPKSAWPWVPIWPRSASARPRCSSSCWPPRRAGSQRGPNWRSPASPRPGTM